VDGQIDGAVERLAKALKALHKQAGSPSYAKIISDAGRASPPVEFNDSSLSDWINGRSVPSDARAFSVLISCLEKRVPRTEGRPSVDRARWERLRDDAWSERQASRAARARRPATEGDAEDSDACLNGRAGQPVELAQDLRGRSGTIADELVAHPEQPDAASIGLSIRRSSTWPAARAAVHSRRVLATIAISSVALFWLLFDQTQSPSTQGPPANLAVFNASSGLPNASETAMVGELKTVDNVLSRYSGDHGAISLAMNDLEYCAVTVGLPNDVAMLTQIQSDLNELALKVKGLPELPIGPVLTQSLQSALRAAADADGSYAQAGKDLVASGCTPMKLLRDSHYQDGFISSTQETEDLRAFLNLWNLLASQYSLQQRNPDDR
jgi:hypothetical protein